MKKYKHLFFDLDDTLWDFKRNSTEALSHLFDKYELPKQGLNLAFFLSTFHAINERLWKQYSYGRIDKEFLRTKRFKMIFNELGYFDEERIIDFGHEYLKVCPYNTHLVDGTLEVLEYLFPKYKLHVITNGFEEIAHIKLTSSGLDKYFEKVITSEKIGVKKPNPIIFEFALTETDAAREASIMIGNDVEADIMGAANVNVDQVYCNFNQMKSTFFPTFEISHLTELMNIL